MAEPLTQEFKDEVRKQAREQAAKWFLGGGVALAVFAISGWVFAAKPYVDDYIRNTSGAQSLVPEDAVMAFDRTPSNPCPEGWTQFKEATSRVILGAGNATDFYEERFSLDEKGQELSPRAYRQHGGEEFHVLRPNEMPMHDHAILNLTTSPNGEHSHRIKDGDAGGQSGFERGGSVRDLLSSQPAPNHTHTVSGQVEMAGGDAGHNNMPPYLALYFCKKG